MYGFVHGMNEFEHSAAHKNGTSASFYREYAYTPEMRVNWTREKPEIGVETHKNSFYGYHHAAAVAAAMTAAPDAVTAGSYTRIFIAHIIISMLM